MAGFEDALDRRVQLLSYVNQNLWLALEHIAPAPLFGKGRVDECEA